MTPGRTPEIKRLCNEFIASLEITPTSFSFDQSGEKYRLHANGIRFHELTSPELQAACVRG